MDDTEGKQFGFGEDDNSGGAPRQSNQVGFDEDPYTEHKPNIRKAVTKAMTSTCSYTSDSGRNCSRLADGLSLQCVKHTCERNGCREQKSSRAKFCPKHA